MILRQPEQKSVSSAWWWIPGIVLVLGSLFFLFGPSTSTTPASGIVGDAEKVKGNEFVNGRYRFANGQTQSNEYAFSGRYSSKTPKGNGQQFGISFRLEEPEPGSYYEASVWRRQPHIANGHLVVQGIGEAAFYERTDYAVREGKDGWEQLQIRFTVPQGQLDYIQVYVYSDGVEAIYFDDLRIVQLPALAPEAKAGALELLISPEGMAELEAKREKALQAGILESEDGDWVNAQLVDPTSSAPIPVKVRLKGDWLDHLEGEKWSFRVKVKDPFAWRQMTTFSLHTPAARYHLHEWFLHRMWQQEDVLTTRYDFVELYLNGRSLGLYAYEEHFVKQLVESKQRREGPILRMQENGFWAGIKRQLQLNDYVQTELWQGEGKAESAPAEPFRLNKIKETPGMAEQSQHAVTLVEQFRQGLRPAREVFDLQRTAKYYAICDVLNAYHAIIWHNQRFYYNPVLDRLEPIGFDGFSYGVEERFTFLGQGLNHPDKLDSGSLFAALFQDRDFMAAYIHELDRMSRKNYVANLLDSLNVEIEERKSWLATEFPGYRFSKEKILEEAQFVQSMLEPFPQMSIRSATKNIQNGQKTVQLQNLHSLPLKITGWSVKAKGDPIILDQPIWLPAYTPREYLVRLWRDSLHRFPQVDKMQWISEHVHSLQRDLLDVEVRLSGGARYLHYSIPGLEKTYVHQLNELAPATIQTPSQELRDQFSLQGTAIFSVSGNEIVFPSGKFYSDSFIIIPEGYEVIFQPGHQLDLIEGAGFISYSPVQIMGTEEEPVRIGSSDKTGQGFSVLQPDGPSTLRHAQFQGLNTLNYQGWTLTGAVTFYEADVRMEQCLFRDNQCEDALNLIRSKVDLDRCMITNAPFDGLDCDFCSGEIHRSVFQDTGNDGMDFSGSRINVYDSRVNNTGDKGISVGEQSDITLFAVAIENTPIGMASKDLSVLMVDSVYLHKLDQGMVAYQKKPEFGISHIVVRAYEAKDVKRLHALCEGCTLQIGDKVIR